MAFEKFVCWKKEMLHKVMDTEAFQVQNDIFLATHHPVKMYRRQEMHEGFADTEYDETRFLHDFLARPNYIFVPVLGSSGTGKSHLVRWLDANIEETDKQRVLLIPKTETNLRKIIGLILEGMEGEKFDEYRRRLEHATGSLTEGEAREMLLNNLALATGPNGPHQGNNLNEYQQHIVEELPNLLHDPFFRKHLLKDSGIIHRLTFHILGNLRTIERIEDRRGFTLADLPLNITDFQKASQLARDFYSLLIGTPELQNETVQWLNLNLDEAIARVLSFNGEDLLALMLDVRESLASQGMELIILIEDFAKLQGIDKQLLEALLVQPDVLPNRNLCVLRSAVAMTTGYFEPLAATVRTRVTFQVNLDMVTGPNQSMMQTGDIERFTSRYLNAVRLSQGEITQWYERVINDNELQEISSACSAHECPHLQPCHEAFGSANGYGLYPFNPTAINRMMERVSGKQFNPRLLLKEVLRHTIENYSDHLAKGEFPPPQLLEHFNGSRMSAIVKKELQRDTVNFPRRQVLLELWSTGDRVVDLHHSIHGAFSLPPLGEAELVQTPPNDKEKKPVKEQKIDLPERVAKNILLLDKWSNGEVLPQNLTQTLREIIYTAVSNYIDWDAELMRKGFFRGNTRLFPQHGVNFKNQATQMGAPGKVQLIIPLDDAELTDTTVVLQGLILYQHHGHWQFLDGPRRFRLYARFLHKWANQVLQQLKSPLQSGKKWDPVPTTVELLALGAAMSGYPSLDGSPDQRVSAILQAPPEENDDQRAVPWKSLLKEYRKHHDSLKDILLSRIPCTKGGSAAIKIIDGAGVVDTLQRITANNWLTETVPADLRSEYEVINKMRQKFLELLASAIAEEKKRCLSWLKLVNEHLGKGESRREVVHAVQLSLEAAQETGVFPGTRADDLQQTMQSFNTKQFDNCLSLVTAMETVSDQAALLSLLGRIDQPLMETADLFVYKVNQFFSGAEARINDDISQYSGGGDFIAVRQGINDTFTKLINLVGQLKR